MRFKQRNYQLMKKALGLALIKFLNVVLYLNTVQKNDNILSI
jgi:hypothetical protein